MESALDCVACFQSQVLRAARAAGATREVQEQLLRRIMRELAEADWRGTPIDIGMPVHRTVREVTGVDDPFAADKRQATVAALELLPALRARVREADDPLLMAVRLSVAGNIIDLGALDSFDLDATLRRVLTAEFAADDYAALRGALEGGQSLLLFADNAGEIVFDRLLLETIATHWGLRASVVVKSGPFINDATVADARQAGLDEIDGLQLRQVSNGDNDGAPTYHSEEVAHWLRSHDVVISKGQANYEALSDRPGVFFLLMAKCPCIASALGVGVGDFVLRRAGGGRTDGVGGTGRGD